MSEPYVEAIVVRCSRPSSARAGDRAVVRPDGVIEGFVGGSCSDETVRLHALRALETGEPILLRILPGPSDAPAEDGAVTVSNPCLSGGALEIFLQPHLPAPRVRVVGDSPVATALRLLAPGVGFDLAEGGDFAVIVASLGHGDEEALTGALRAGVPYVALVASARRGAAVVQSLDVDDALRARVRTPAGLDIGARTPEEIALSILAELVAFRRNPERLVAPAAPTPEEVAPAAHCCHHATP